MSDKKKMHQHLLKELHEIWETKNAKYGDSFGETHQEFGSIAALVRISDKYRRMKQLITHPEEPNDTDESLEDTLTDMANYCVMLALELRVEKEMTKE